MILKRALGHAQTENMLSDKLWIDSKNHLKSISSVFIVKGIGLTSNRSDIVNFVGISLYLKLPTESSQGVELVSDLY